MTTPGIKSFAVCACTLLYSGLASGVASHPGYSTYRQPDGSRIQVEIHGDHNLHWYTDTEGRLLMPVSDGRLIPADKEWRERFAIRRNEPQRAHDPSPYTSFPTLGRQKSLIILVEYQDRNLTYTEKEFRDMLNSPGYSSFGASGSARDYFLENSAGRFDPEFDVYGPVKLSHPMSYYGSDDDALAHEMAREACVALDDMVDFSEYDRDGDGWVDNVYIFYAGHGEADGGGVNTVWPHSSDLFRKGVRLMLDGVQIGSYSCSNELIGNTTRMVGIGTFCHEFSHVLGLPDLYTTNNTDTFTPYYYSLMDHGNYNNEGRTPCALTGYERYYLGWCEPLVLNGSGSVRLESIDSNMCCRIDIPGYTEEYYILENRQNTGWDMALPGHGMLVWHIDYSKDVWDRNAVNNDATRQRVDLIEADDTATLSTSSGDPFPGTSGVESIGFLKDHTGTPLPHSIHGIRENNGVVEFEFNGSSRIPGIPSGLTATSIEDDGFKLEWTDIEESESYLVSLHTKEGERIRQHYEYTLYAIDSQFIEISGLEPETTYFCTVRARTGITVGEASRQLEVQTSAPGIRHHAPEALEAEGITDSGFTARWKPMEDADEYIIDVYRISREDVDSDVASFTSPLSVPEGWTTTATGTMSVSGYYGNAAPSLRFSKNAEILETPVYDRDIYSVSLWIRGYKADDLATVTASVMRDGKWTDEGTFHPVNEEGTVSELIPAAGARAFRLTFNASGGSSICIDDVTVSFGKGDVRYTVLDSEPVGSGDSYTVESLIGDTEYRYVVRGRKGEHLSLPSQEISVRTLKDASGIGMVETMPFSEIIYDLTGNIVGERSGLKPGIYILVRDGKSYKIRI